MPGPSWYDDSVDLGDVLRRRALLALDDVELDTLALRERAETAALDGRVVDEAILAAVLRRDEAEALLVVEPLHGAGGTHYHSLCCSRCDEVAVFPYQRSIALRAGIHRPHFGRLLTKRDPALQRPGIS